jgi:hypothetical protein
VSFCIAINFSSYAESSLRGPGLRNVTRPLARLTLETMGNAASASARAQASVAWQFTANHVDSRQHWIKIAELRLLPLRLRVKSA